MIMYSSCAEPVLQWQSRGSPSAAPSWYMKLCLEKRSSTFCPSPQSWDGCLWFGLEIRGPFRSAIGTGAATAPIGTTTTSPGLTRVPELGTGAPCTLWIPGRLGGPATREDQWSIVCASCSYVLIRRTLCCRLELMLQTWVMMSLGLSWWCKYIAFASW